MIFAVFLLGTLIVGTGSRRLDEAVLTGARSLCLGAGIRDTAVPLCTPVLLYEGGVQGGILCTDMLS